MRWLRARTSLRMRISEREQPSHNPRELWIVDFGSFSASSPTGVLQILKTTT